MKTNAIRRPRINSTIKMLVGLTLFYFVCKTLGRS